jgi:3-deoxy-manno-octulosonate cytidylyltransferase (CMP-KDO synthetase)
MKKNLRKNADIIGIIPIRYESSRFPGKALADIGGKPMIQWVVERARQAKLLSDILVATDDERIYQCIEDFGGHVVMTPRGIPSGSDRVAFVVKDLDVEIAVNIQGDEPFVKPQEIDLVAQILLDDEKAVMGTLVKKITRVEELTSPNTAKVIVDQNLNALYFSRSPIPFCRDEKNYLDWITHHTYYKQIGIYSYRKDFLLQYTQWKETSLEDVEKLEQLRVLEKGYCIRVAETEFDAVCVDTLEDLERARQMFSSGLVF